MIAKPATVNELQPDMAKGFNGLFWDLRRTARLRIVAGGGAL
jgi:hypothetical protein